MHSTVSSIGPWSGERSSFETWWKNFPVGHSLMLLFGIKYYSLLFLLEGTFQL
jgi:hypothetical protein